MKIGPLDPNTPALPVAGERKAPAAGGSAAEASAKVQLSSSASLLGGGDVSFDKAQVERIAQAIRDGKFEVNAEAIADKLIANARELLGKAGG